MQCFYIFIWKCFSSLAAIYLIFAANLNALNSFWNHWIVFASFASSLGDSQSVYLIIGRRCHRLSTQLCSAKSISIYNCRLAFYWLFFIMLMVTNRIRLLQHLGWPCETKRYITQLTARVSDVCVCVRLLLLLLCTFKFISAQIHTHKHLTHRKTSRQNGRELRQKR